MGFLELKIPPVAVAVMIGCLSWVLESMPPDLPLAGGVRRVLAVILVVLGAGIGLAGVIEFHRAQTTVNPHRPKHASSLVTTGIYRYTRNPMYLGLLLFLAAWAIYLGSVLAFAPLILFVLYMDRFQIEPEERALVIVFGKEYTAYRARVRRWL